MGTTTRLPAALKAEADVYAAELGISLNALLAVALRDYLDVRRRLKALEATGLQGPAVQATAGSPAASPGAASVQRPRNPNDLCGCGSRIPWKRCHGRPGAESD